METQERTIQSLTVERGNLVSVCKALKEKQEQQEFELTAMQATSDAVKETISGFERRLQEGKQSSSLEVLVKSLT